MSKKRKPQKRKNYAARTAIWIIVVALVALVAVAVASTALYKPGQKNPINPNDNAETTEPAERETDENPPEIKVPNRKEGFYNFLVVGKDDAALNTDVIMVVSYDTENGNISVMQIPRDTYISLDGVPHKINSVLATMYSRALIEGMDDAMGNGMQGFADIISDNMNLIIDYYALIDLDCFRNIVDIIGGVEMDVPFDMDYVDPYQNLYIHIKAGKQVLDGEKAEQLIRFRDGLAMADIGRIDLQKLFMSAFLKQVKSSLTISRVPAIMNEVFDNVTTSLSMRDCIYFAQNLLSNVDLSNISMITVPGVATRAYVTSGNWYYIIHRKDMLALINEHFCVYDSPITDDSFDVNYIFTDVTKSHYQEIYNGTSGNVDDLSSSAEDINKDSIDIPLV